jgi:hypothetical protein
MAPQLLANPGQVAVGREPEEQFVSERQQFKAAGGRRAALNWSGN